MWKCIRLTIAKPFFKFSQLLFHLCRVMASSQEPLLSVISNWSSHIGFLGPPSILRMPNPSLWLRPLAPVGLQALLLKKQLEFFPSGNSKAAFQGKADLFSYVLRKVSNLQRVSSLAHFKAKDQNGLPFSVLTTELGLELGSSDPCAEPLPWWYTDGIELFVILGLQSS